MKKHYKPTTNQQYQQTQQEIKSQEIREKKEKEQTLATRFLWLNNQLPVERMFSDIIPEKLFPPKRL